MLITHPSGLASEAPEGHPERPERLLAIEETLMAEGLFDFLLRERAPAASREALLRAHDASLIDDILGGVHGGGLRRIDDDTYLHERTPEAALHAAGALILATDRVLDDSAQRAFCCVRPPGHHATRHQAMGFCFFNNLAVGVLHALEVRQLQRIAVLDFDVHDCNGTVDILGNDPRVLICSTFQHPLYPYTGTSEPNGHVVRSPLPAGSDGRSFREAVLRRWLPEVESFAPELIYVSAGFDGHALDDISELGLKTDDYRWVTEQIVSLAERFCAGRVISTLEGGYQLEMLGRSAAAHIRVLMNL